MITFRLRLWCILNAQVHGARQGVRWTVRKGKRAVEPVVPHAALDAIVRLSFRSRPVLGAKNNAHLHRHYVRLQELALEGTAFFFAQYFQSTAVTRLPAHTSRVISMWFKCMSTGILQALRTGASHRQSWFVCPWRLRLRLQKASRALWRRQRTPS